MFQYLRTYSGNKRNLSAYQKRYYIASVSSVLLRHRHLVAPGTSIWVTIHRPARPRASGRFGPQRNQAAARVYERPVFREAPSSQVRHYVRVTA